MYNLISMGFEPFCYALTLIVFSMFVLSGRSF